MEHKFNPQLKLTFSKGTRVVFSIENTNDMDLCINGSELFGTKKQQQYFLNGFLQGLAAAGEVSTLDTDDVAELINKILGLK